MRDRSFMRLSDGSYLLRFDLRSRLEVSSSVRPHFWLNNTINFPSFIQQSESIHNAQGAIRPSFSLIIACY